MLFFAKKLPNAQARGRTRRQRRFACCVGVALAYGPGGPDGPNGQDGGASVYPVGLRGAVWYGSGADLPRGYARLVLWQRWCACCGGVALVSDLSDKSDVSDKMGASRYTPWVCCAAVWFGSGQIYRRGDYCNRRTNHTIS